MKTIRLQNRYDVTVIETVEDMLTRVETYAKSAQQARRQVRQLARDTGTDVRIVEVRRVYRR